MTTLDEIRTRVEAATEGPWFREYGDVITSDEDLRPSEQDADGNGPSLRICEKAPHLDRRDRQGINNAAFIAHARTDIPKLLAALDAVLDAHREIECFDEDGEPTGATACSNCKDHDDESGERVHEVWPCFTIQEINRALAGDLTMATLRKQFTEALA